MKVAQRTFGSKGQQRYDHMRLSACSGCHLQVAGCLELPDLEQRMCVVIERDSENGDRFGIAPGELAMGENIRCAQTGNDRLAKSPSSTRGIHGLTFQSSPDGSALVVEPNTTGARFKVMGDYKYSPRPSPLSSSVPSSFPPTNTHLIPFQPSSNTWIPWTRI